MWIFSKTGFMSIVEDMNDSDNLMVRFRVIEDAEEFCGNIGYEYSVTPQGDYRFRVSAPRVVVMDEVHELMANIDYTNFKDAAAQHNTTPERMPAYLGVWAKMADLQNRSEA